MPNFRAIKFLSLINGYNKKGIEVLIYTGQDTLQTIRIDRYINKDAT